MNGRPCALGGYAGTEAGNDWVGGWNCVEAKAGNRVAGGAG